MEALRPELLDERPPAYDDEAPAEFAPGARRARGGGRGGGRAPPARARLPRVAAAGSFRKSLQDPIFPCSAHGRGQSEPAGDLRPSRGMPSDDLANVARRDRRPASRSSCSSPPPPPSLRRARPPRRRPSRAAEQRRSDERVRSAFPTAVARRGGRRAPALEDRADEPGLLLHGGRSPRSPGARARPPPAPRRAQVHPLRQHRAGHGRAPPRLPRRRQPEHDRPHPQGARERAHAGAAPSTRSRSARIPTTSRSPGMRTAAPRESARTGARTRATTSTRTALRSRAAGTSTSSTSAGATGRSAARPARARPEHSCRAASTAGPW